MQKFRGPHRFGFSLVEILIALAVLAVIAAFAVPKILSQGNKTTETARQQSAVSSLQNGMQIAEGEVGLPPLTLGPGQLLANRLKTRTYNTVAIANVPEACLAQPGVVSNNDNHAVLPDDSEIFGLSPRSWPNQSATGVKGDEVCIVSGKTVSIAFLPRSGAVIAQAVPVTSSSQASTSGTSQQTASGIDTTASNTVLQETAPPVQIQTPAYAVTVIARSLPSGNGINNASIIGTLSGQTDSTGTVVFPNVLQGTTLSLRATSPYYTPPLVQTITVTNGPRTMTFNLRIIPVSISSSNQLYTQWYAQMLINAGIMSTADAVLTYSYWPGRSAVITSLNAFYALRDNPFYYSMLTPAKRSQLLAAIAAYGTSPFGYFLDQYAYDQTWLNNTAYPACAAMRGTHGEVLCDTY